jgi:8-oxo-dGTP pyrophosphatase MutT (NUDIX family)
MESVSENLCEEHTWSGQNSFARRALPWHHGRVLSGLLSGYRATGETESADVRRMLQVTAGAADPWSRALPLHFTGSALVVHPETRRVLLRWHVRHGRWLQVGGHGDPGEHDPLAVALREAVEETGLDPAGVEVLGTLPELFISRTGFRVVPVLAWWRRPSAVAPVDAAEVAAVERVRISELADPAARVMVRTPGGYLSPAFRVRGLLVWGFTAGLVDRLLALGGWERPWDTETVVDAPLRSR